MVTPEIKVSRLPSGYYRVEYEANGAPQIFIGGAASTIMIIVNSLFKAEVNEFPSDK